MFKRMLYALLLSALVLLETAAAATASGHRAVDGNDEALRRAAAGVDRQVGALDARIAALDAEIAAIDARLAGDLPQTERLRLEQERSALVQSRDELAQSRGALLTRVCNTALALHVVACGWTG
jgi:uncharacterized protein involved in exopolysaccharide biosynthesis